MAATYPGKSSFLDSASQFDAGLVTMIAQVQPSVVQVRSGQHGAGSGIVWRADGLVLTNYHVVARLDAVQIALHDGRELAGSVLASDPTLDLALVRVATDDLPAANIGESQRLRVGEIVVAVGNPWGQRGVATLGIVSGVGAIATPWRHTKAEYIRSDVTLAPGNSGGPLLNAQGEVVGINAMIFGGDLSVAIPADVASQFVAVALAEVPPFGIEVQPIRLPKAVQAATNYQQGLMIIGVQAGSIASAAGLYVGDVLLDVFDTPLHDLHTLKYALVGRHNGKPLRLRYARGEHIGSITV